MGTSAFDLSTLKPVSTPPSGGASAFDLSTLKPVQTTPTQTPQRAAAPAPPAAPSFGQRLSAGWQGLEAGGLKAAETGFETGNAPVAPQSKPAQPVSGAALKAPAPPAPRPATPYRPQATVSAAPPPSLWERARESVANSAVGAAVQSTMPKVAQALGLEPTESEASPTYQQNRQSMPQLPAWTQKPILPAIERGVTAINRAADPRSYTAAGRAVRAQEEAGNAQQLSAYDAAHPYQAAVAQAGREFAEGMTTPSNLAQLALVPAAKPLMALYALQGANGTYDSIEQAWEAHKAGKNPEAVKLAAEAGLSGIVTAMAGRAALKGAFPVDTARPTVRDPLVEIPTERPMLTAGTPTTIEGTVPRNGGDGGGPRGRGGAGGGDETVPRNVPRGTVEQPLLTAGETKPILHDETASAADLTESAQKLKPILGDAVLAATKGVPGANLEAVRAKALDRTVDKMDRQNDKTDRQNVQPSQIGDISGAKVTVPDQQAADQVLQNLDRQMPVESVNGQVTGEPGKNGVRQVQATVRLPETGEPVKRAEVLIQTPEMNRATDQTHDDYRKAQELRQAGKDAEAQKLENKIMRQHDEAERAAQQRLEASNAVSERGPAGVVQRPSQEAGGGRGERERVEPVQQGKEVAPTGAQAAGEKETIAQLPSNLTEASLGNRPAVGGHDGKPTELIVSPTNKMPATYRLVEASDLVPSHNAQSFEPNPAYPTGVQERDYKGSKAAQTRVIEQAQNYDPAYTVNTNQDAVNGPPVITPDGTVLGGNSRAMSTQRVYAAGQGETYRDALKRDAASYGLTADQVDAMKQPVLVRQVERPGSLDEARRLGSALNKSATGALGVSERAVSAGKNLKPETLSTVSNMLAEDDSSMRELLGRRGPEILRMMEQDGAITDRERPQFLDAHGGLSEEGKTFVERAMLGSVVNDSHLMDVAPKAILGKLEKSLGSIASIGSRPDEWNLLPVLRPALLRAVAEHASIAQRGSTVELTVNQRDMFGPGRNPLVDALVRVLDEKPNAVCAKFEAFAKDANQNLPGEVRMFGGGQAFDAFNNAFGSKLSDEEFRNGIDELLNLKGSTAAAKRQEAPAARPNAVVPQRASGGSTLRAPAPPTGRTAVEPSTGGGSTRAARPADLAPRAPAPPAATKSPFTDGRQKTAIELRGADGNWQPATLDYYNGGVNGQPRRGRVTLANGSKDNDVSDSRMRLATKETPEPAKALESSDETVRPIGPPIDGDIANLVRDRISKGLPVKIFTRRISREPREANRRAVDAAIREQFGVSLPITDVKTAGDGAIYDDSSNVEHNTGRILSHTTNPGDEGKPILVDLDGTLRKSIPSGVTSPGVPPGGEAITERGIEGEKGTSTAGQPSGAVPTEVGRQPQRGGAVEPVATREAEPAPARSAEESRAAETVRRETASTEPEWSGTRGAHMQERLLAKGKFDRELSRAKASTEPENVVRAQANPIQIHGVQVVQLNADAFHFLSERLSPGVDWTGVFLDRSSASRWVAEIGARASKLRQEGMGAAADAAKKLQLALDGIREPDGSIILLREDYNDSTIREELAHRWQTKTDLHGSYEQTEVSQRPEFEEVNQRLRDIGYDLSPENQATELIAKALAGDPAMKWTPEQQNAVVSAALHAAIDEMGSGVLDDMAPYDPAVKTSVEEAKQYGKESDARAGGEAVRGVVETPDKGLSQVGRERGSNLSEEPGNRPAGPGGQRGVSEGRAAQGELGAFQRAPKPPASRALPGMERDIEAQRDAAAEEQGRQLTERLRAPRPPISRAAGIMERESPLFRDTDAGGQGSLFQRALASKKEITEKPEFKSWFGDSKAVDEDGSPKIVFHGTAKSFDVFDPNLTGARTIVDTGDFGKAAYFADSPEVAGGYATGSKLSQPSEYVGPQGTVEDLQKIVNRAISDPNVKAREGDAARSVMRFMNDDVSFKDAMARAGDADLASKFGGSLRPVGEFNENIMPVYLKAENPLVLKNAEDFRKLREFAKVSNEDEWFNLSPTEQAKAIQDKGYDSVHDVSYGQWAVFDPRQVKSAIGNRGTFDPSNPSILFQRKEGKGSADKDDAARMAREGLPLKEDRPAPRETTATTGNHDIDKGIDETIDELGKLPKRKMSASEHMDQAVDAATKGVTEKTEAVKGAFAGVKGAAAGAWSTWCTPPAWSDYRQSLSDLRSAEFKAARQVDVYQKTLVKVAPSERERNAITIYGEARNNTELKYWQMAARAIPNISKEAVRAFDDALKLTPEQKSVAEAHRDYYNQQLKILTDAGLLPTGASNYTMHMFASDPETLSRLNSVTNLNELSPNPSFLNKRVYPSFFEAIKNGEKPTTLDAGKILSAYHDAFTKTFMTRSFIRSLIYGNAKDGRPLAILESRAGTTVLDKKGTSGARILKQPKRPEDMSDYVRDPAGQMKNFTWELTDEDREMLAPGYSQMPKDEQSKLFGPDDPRFPVPAGKVLALRGDILLHPEVAKQVHDLVTKSWFKTKPGKTWGAMTGPERVEEGARLGLNAIGTAGATAKGVILYGSGFHQVQLGVHSMEHLVNPFKLPSMDEQANNPIVLEGVAHGLNLLNIDTTGVLSTLPGMGTYHRYLFRDYIPRLKAEMYKHAFARNMDRFGGAKDGKAATMTRDEIHLLTAQQANAAFGGLDPAFFEQLNRMNNKTYQAIEHLLLFSPDFTKARIQFAAQGIGEIPRLAARVASKPFKSTQTPPPLHTEQLAALLRGALVMYGICRITNAVINRDQGAKGAHWDWQDALVVVTPKSWGVLGDKHIGLRMVQGDMMELIKNPVTWAYNRLNPATLRPAIEFLTGRDNFGRQESKMNFAKNYLKQMAPIQVQKLFTTSDEGWVDSLFTSAGLQLGNYRSPLEQEAHKLRLSDIPDRPGTEEKMDEARAGVQEVKKLRDAGAIGENPSAWPEPAQKMVDDIRDKVANGKMSSRAASTIIRRAGMTEFQYDVSHLSMDDAMSIWNKAGAGERAELKDVITEKASRSLEATAKDKGIDAMNELEARLKDKGITVGPQ